MPDFTYTYPRPALTVDALMLKYTSGILKLLLIKRKHEPFKDFWAFPGGFVEPNETVEEALTRELKEETGLVAHDPVQFYTASAPGRDPRGWTISVVYMDVVPEGKIARAGDDAAEAEWHGITDLPALAFDHEAIVLKALDYLRDPFSGAKFGKRMLPDSFSEDEIRSLYQQLYSSESEAERVISFLKQHLLILRADSSGLFEFSAAL